MRSYDLGEDILEKWEKENEKLLKKLDDDRSKALEVHDLNPNDLPPPPAPKNNAFKNRKSSVKPKKSARGKSSTRKEVESPTAKSLASGRKQKKSPSPSPRKDSPKKSPKK